MRAIPISRMEMHMTVNRMDPPPHRGPREGPQAPTEHGGTPSPARRPVLRKRCIFYRLTVKFTVWLPREGQSELHEWKCTCQSTRWPHRPTGGPGRPPNTHRVRGRSVVGRREARAHCLASWLRYRTQLVAARAACDVQGHALRPGHRSCMIGGPFRALETLTRLRVFFR